MTRAYRAALPQYPLRRANTKVADYNPQGSLARDAAAALGMFALCAAVVLCMALLKQKGVF